MSNSRRLLVGVALAVVMVAACGDEPPRLVQPTPVAEDGLPTEAGPSPATTPSPDAREDGAAGASDPTPTSQSPDPAEAAYPLDQAQALALLGTGIPVAGWLPGGGEAVAMKAVETVAQSGPTRIQKCRNEYDAFLGRDVYVCGEENAEPGPVERTVYRVSGGVSARSFGNALGAIANIAGYGAIRWRRLG